MTELERLIAEQAADGDRVWSVSIDAWPSGADLFHRRSRKLVTDPRHGTLNGYIHLRCRCDKCRAASAEAKRDWRRRNPKQRKTRQRDRLCCGDCGSVNVVRERVYE